MTDLSTSTDTAPSKSGQGVSTHGDHHHHGDHDCCDHGHHHHRAEPYVRSAKKVGANESCPCASGLKYKKCCGRPS